MAIKKYAILLLVVLTTIVMTGCGAGGGSDTPAGLATVTGQFKVMNSTNTALLSDWSGVKVYVTGKAEAFGTPVVTNFSGRFTINVNPGVLYKLEAITGNYLKFVSDNINVANAQVYDIGVVTMNCMASPPPTPNL